MKNEELLKVIGKIDDELIENKKVVSSERKFRWQPIIKTAAVCACCFALILGATLPNLRMGKKSDAGAAPEAMYEAESLMAYSATDTAIYDYDEPMEMKMKAEEAGNGVYEPAKLPNKLVYRANLSIETEGFDKTVEGIKAAVERFNGYFENSESYNGSYYYDNTSKSGWFTVRVPQSSYQDFIDEITTNYHITSQSENIDNITEEYYNTQDRLDTLRIKEDRLHELLSKANSMSDIIEIENNLSYTEAEINSLTRTIKNYDNMTDYASINIDVCQVKQMGSSVTSEGFGERLARAFKNGFRNFAEGIADLIVWAGYNVIEIVIVIAAVIIIWRFKLIRKLIKWIKK